MAKCGSQCVLCNLPIRFDTYSGCSHACRYCFVQRKSDLKKIKKDETAKSLRSFIEGNRTAETAWCDWNIPIHWGGMSDPFQPCEKAVGVSLECLKVFAETQYPFVVSTKGRLVVHPDYLELLSKCNCVVQISMVCSRYDKLELGCPPWEERLEMVRTLAKHVKRVIIRTQPYMPEVFEDVMANIKKYAEAGAYGIILEGMKFAKAKKGLVRVGGDCCYPLDVLRRDFERIKAECHKHGLKFYSGENRLRPMGDSMTCCGIDGLEGFKGNDYNVCMIMNGQDPQPTEKMKEIGSGGCFKTLYQAAGSGPKIRAQSFYGLMQKELRDKREFYEEVFGLRE